MYIYIYILCVCICTRALLDEDLVTPIYIHEALATEIAF